MPPASNISVEHNVSKIESPSTPLPTWDRISTWASENKTVVYSIAGVAIVITGASIAYHLIDSKPFTSSHNSQKKSTKKDRRRKKDELKKGSESERSAPELKPKTVLVEPVPELLDVNEEVVAKLSEQDKIDLASKLKLAGNTAFGAKDFPKAIKLYGQAILCKPDPIFYSNRAACYNALREWEKVVEDTTAALNLNSEYVKALNRRAIAYEQLNKFSEALLDFTASCIIDGFRNELSAQSVERLLKKVAEAKVSSILATRVKRLPSPTFVTNYLQSFRARPPPLGLEATNEITEGTGKGQLQLGLREIEKKTVDGYEEAATAFKRALELGDLGDYEAFAYNMRGTFRYLSGESSEAIDDLTKSITLQPELTQSYVKRASMYLELGDKGAAVKDFENAIQQNNDDPDIFYHRAQLHFILGEFADAAKDYQRSIDLDHTFIFSHIQLGVTQYKMGSIASSMATFRRCIKNFDNVPDVYNYYGEILLDQQKFQEAIEKFDTAIEIEKKNKSCGINVLPLINKALALFQWNQDFSEAEKLCQQALSIDPMCDIAIATMAQLLLQQGKVSEALQYFERAAELARTENEILNALSYAEATRTQLAVQEKYPQLASRLQGMNLNPGMG